MTSPGEIPDSSRTDWIASSYAASTSKPVANPPALVASSIFAVVRDFAVGALETTTAIKPFDSTLSANSPFAISFSIISMTPSGSTPEPEAAIIVASTPKHFLAGSLALQSTSATSRSITTSSVAILASLRTEWIAASYPASTSSMVASKPATVVGSADAVVMEVAEGEFVTIASVKPDLSARTPRATALRKIRMASSGSTPELGKVVMVV
mmetsp:Transcript_17342/g.47838  ORF Transcript_17342/g.47838 Transcript_17342/m.47838 type:complete len:211 (+) Transcript_17342:6895-7527(+)